MTSEKSEAALRWAILANVLKKKRVETNEASVRRFLSFGLFSLQPIQVPVQPIQVSVKPIQVPVQPIQVPVQPKQVPVQPIPVPVQPIQVPFQPIQAPFKNEDTDFIWYKFSSAEFPTFSAEIKQLTRSLEICDLLEFDNTGNVCIWPSEEILAYFCLKHKHKFKDKEVCELGGGMTCLAGVAVAMETEASRVILTDGNAKSVKNLDEIVSMNHGKFGETEVKASVVRWDDMTSCGDRFDYIISADCLFFDDSRVSLVTAMHKLLKPDGEVIIFAPTRGQTMAKFISIASEIFNVSQDCNYDQVVNRLHNKFLDKDKDLYDPDLHFPILLSLTKNVLESTTHQQTLAPPTSRQ